MLTISEVAKKLKISNRQVNELIEYGYLNVANISRNPHNGINYLFSENQVETLDLHAHLAEINELKANKKISSVMKTSSYKKVFNALQHYDRFLEAIADHPDKKILTVCFYLYHLNHYAKRYMEQAESLYTLKHQVLRKLYAEYPGKIVLTYLIGPDRNKIWLCEDCKEAARTAGLSYSEYIKKEMYCPKCSVTTTEREYYSLVEFSILIEEYGFTFHAPRSAVRKWINTDKLSQGTRKTAKYNDHMYFYGRLATQVEEKIFPLTVVLEFLKTYLSEANNTDSDDPELLTF
ncbi:MAG TPA: hypothetical protein VHQ70_04140 [Syntrophomonadaceae bacterium]|nr:hypothetical protein [Syntrophomonadaceae bacterium]